MQSQKRAEEEKKAHEKEMQAKAVAFRSKILKSDDLHDNLAELAEHISEFTGATAAYIGKVTKPINGISDGLAEDENDKAHLIPNAEEEIQYIHASAACKFMEGKILHKDEGITFRVFAESDNKEDEDLPNYLLVPEVVRETDIHYYQVPRLGSYMAIQLEYESCLYEEAFDSALNNYNLVNNQRLQQEEEKRTFEEQQADLEAEKLEAGEEFVRETRNWQEFNYAQFKTRKKQFVVCLDTMG